MTTETVERDPTDWGEITSAWLRIMNAGRDCEEVVVEWTGRRVVRRGEYVPVTDTYFYNASVRGELAVLVRSFLNGHCPLNIVADRMEEAPTETDCNYVGLPVEKIAQFLRRQGRTRI